MQTSRIPGFYNMTVEQRRELLAKMESFTEEDTAYLFSKEALSTDTADNMIEMLWVHSRFLWD